MVLCMVSSEVLSVKSKDMKMRQQVVQGAETAGLERVLREYPRVLIAANNNDSAYPALAWESWAAQVLIQRYRYQSSRRHPPHNHDRH